MSTRCQLELRYELRRATRVAIGPLNAADLVADIGAGRLVNGFAVPDVPWLLRGVVCRGTIDTPIALTDAMDVALRGAHLAVQVTPELLDPLLEACVRAGIDRWSPPELDATEWAPLLDELARGSSIADAARTCHMSIRSAFRRLHDARHDLSVTDTVAAVAVWSGRDVGP